MSFGGVSGNQSLNDIVLSWSVDEILNNSLSDQVKTIPNTFETLNHYFESFVSPLLEETRAELASRLAKICRAPFAEVVDISESKHAGQLIYNFQIDYWRKGFSGRSKEPYRTLPGDVFIISDSKLESISALQRVGCTWTFAYVTDGEVEIDNDYLVTGKEWYTQKVATDISATRFIVKPWRDIGVKEGRQKSFFVVFLMNITTPNRIWKSLHISKNVNLFQQVISPDYEVEEDRRCCFNTKCQLREKNLLSGLNDSQTQTILKTLTNVICNHKTRVELIWGPPGTGKTKTICMLLLTLLDMSYKTLVCAPINAAVYEVALRVLNLLQEPFGAELSCSVGDILLFGDKKRLKVNSITEDIYLNTRVDKLRDCLGPLGWEHYMITMIDFLENCPSPYDVYVEGFAVRERFEAIASPLRRCMLILCTHIPKRFLKENFELLGTLANYVEELKKIFSSNVATKDEIPQTLIPSLADVKNKCISVLRKLQVSLQGLGFPNYLDRGSIVDFCYENALLIICTASSSFMLHSVSMKKPPNLLVIDEAAQLKECESSIPFQLPGLMHAILVGDWCQLSAFVSSKVSSEAGFGRSLFERLSMLGHPNHLLNVQYRMHPSISRFPNFKFYSSKIQDAPLVQDRFYEKKYLDGPMFGPYSFINVVGIKEEINDDGHSQKNMVEVFLVVKLLQNIHKAWDGVRKISIGVISPYTAQVEAIRDRIGLKYEKADGLNVKVKSVDGFQGGEEDIIIISTVRSNSNGDIGFLSSPQRTNVALTRARHCLWILGNERTLVRSNSVWEALVRDAKDRDCFFNADGDKDMAKVIINVKKELDQLDDLLNQDSVLFKHTIWKVLFSDNFIKSFAKVTSLQKKKTVIALLLKLSNGWRPKNRNVHHDFEKSSQSLKQFKVEDLYVLCTIDIKKESGYIQVLKVWDLLPLEEIPKLVKRLEAIFSTYSETYISHCKEKCIERDLEIPKTWVASANIVQFKDLETNELRDEPSEEDSQRRRYIENSRASESLKLMKFYSLSCGTVKHLLSDRGGEQLDLPFEVTDEQWKIISMTTSTFILGRSGTGKTTILAMKLFGREKLYSISSEEILDQGFATSEGNNVSESIAETKENELIAETNERPLRQLFVTVSPKLCYAVQQHISGLKRFACQEKFSEGNISTDMDGISQFEDLPNSFVGIAHSKYPLVITFDKFLRMLDGTVGNSFFENYSDGYKSSIAFETCLETKEVTYDKFISLYWDHFNVHLKKRLDPSRVFTEIISYIKGGLKDGRVCESKLSREDYVSLYDRRGLSTLTEQTRAKIYDIYDSYEKLKRERREFDLADFVNDLHHRLRNAIYEGDEIDFVYIDEVQDLTMRQIALFKYICRNVEDGFVFAGDTAQTIARGIDFRFEDIRSLFYKEFLMDLEVKRGDSKMGRISDLLCLTENFRTHDGVLKLAQSVIDLLYHFFSHLVDILDPEKSLICGEDPIFFEPLNHENAIVTIFGKGGSENASGDLVGFGAEQVILVRDDSARKEIFAYVGKQALILTILECKGLEFQDVLLYNFFGSSPLKNQWRVIYDYVDKQDNGNSKVYPKFDHARHNVLCSELKQLYVAITRTRQRLWICESVSEFSEPMIDYWRKKSFVQVRKLDESLAQAMQVASTPEEWKARGIQLFHENNYEMATMCFERAGDVTWEKWAKAAGMKARACFLRNTNTEGARLVLLQAAEIFDSIGKAAESAACYYEAGEFEKGLQYIRGWKQINQKDFFISSSGEEIERAFLEKCAILYHDIKDYKSLLKFLKNFCTTDFIRNFLKKMNCYHELLVVEQSFGNLIDNSEIARREKNDLLEATLLEKAGKFRDLPKLCEILEYSYRSDVISDDYVSLHSLIYLADRILLRASFTQESFFTTKSSVVEHIKSGYWDSSPSCEVSNDFFCSDIYNFLGMFTELLLFDKRIKKSLKKTDSYYPLFLLRGVVILLLLCLNSGEYTNVLIRFLGMSYLTSYLPRDFVEVLRRKERKTYLIKNDSLRRSVVAEALMKIGNPLIVASRRGFPLELSCDYSIFMDTTALSRDEVILEVLFPEIRKSGEQLSSALDMRCCDYDPSPFLSSPPQSRRCTPYPSDPTPSGCSEDEL